MDQNRVPGRARFQSFRGRGRSLTPVGPARCQALSWPLGEQCFVDRPHRPRRQVASPTVQRRRARLRQSEPFGPVRARLGGIRKQVFLRLTPWAPDGGEPSMDGCWRLCPRAWYRTEPAVGRGQVHFRSPDPADGLPLLSAGCAGSERGAQGCGEGEREGSRLVSPSAPPSLQGGCWARLTARPWHCPGRSPKRADLELQGKAGFPDISSALPRVSWAQTHPYPGVLKLGSLPQGPPAGQPSRLRVQAPTGRSLVPVCSWSLVASSPRAKASNVCSWFALLH